MIIINCRLGGHDIPLLSWLHPQLFIKDPYLSLWLFTKTGVCPVFVMKSTKLTP